MTPSWVATVGDYAGLVLVIAAVMALVGRWVKRGIVQAVTPRFDSLEETIKRVSDRLDDAEAQLRTDGGLSLRDAVNRIERSQMQHRLILRQVARAVHAAGLHAPVQTDLDEPEEDIA